MNWNDRKFAATRLVWMLLCAGTMSLTAAGAWAQEAATDAAPPAAAATDAAGPTDAAVPARGADVAIERRDALLDEPDPPREAALPAGAVEPTPGAEAVQQVMPDEPTGVSMLAIAGVVLGLFVVAVLVGNFLSRRWKMPDHGWKISLVLWLLGASILTVTFGEFKFGPDLAGGITLVFELEDAPGEAITAPGVLGDPAERPIRAAGREFQISELIGALKKRLDPDGTKEITIRQYGPAIEIIIPRTGDAEMEFVKRKILEMGNLEFRITADARFVRDRPIIEESRQLGPSQKDVVREGNKVAEWVAYEAEEFAGDPHIVTRVAAGVPEALVLIDPWNVTGEYLRRATKGLDEVGGPAVHFTFDRIGAERFRRLTSANRPSPATPDVYRHLGIILDKNLISAPTIRTTISDRGMISGGAMTDREVDHLIEILNAGSLPAALSKTPISEEVISPTLGAVTVEQGKWAITISMIAVVLFMMMYYKFAGIVACLALSFNLLLVLSLLVLIQAALTLPGLAGLVLTIGMSVDANVLIYERIREELRGGAALRMAIRNGFGKAFSAIVDANVTTIIGGLALFYIGTDQVKGFAVTLILGILTSMFTAIFFARLVFDIVERQGLKRIRMLQLLSKPNYNFLKARWVAGAASVVLLLVGMAAVTYRGAEAARLGDLRIPLPSTPGLLDIDFTGGSSVTFTLRPEHRMPIGDVRTAMSETELAEQNLVVVERGDTRTRYTVDTNEQDVERVKQIIHERFSDGLLSYSLEIGELRPFAENDFTGTETQLQINVGPEYAPEDGLSFDALHEWMRGALIAEGHGGLRPTLIHADYRPGSTARFKDWTVRLGGLDEEQAAAVFQRLQANMEASPMFPLANMIGGRVSRDMQTAALLAITVSLIGVIGYLWIRFQKVAYGLAAGAALIHDVAVTIGLMALSAYIVATVPGLASALQIESFQISLAIVAALLTIIGYSLNDTIVTFDRLREIKGKTPYLTADMVNASVNQTLSRTILTALTSFFVVAILYFFGGEGIHGFAFAFLVGIVVGTYSSIYVAAPVLLWLTGTPAAPGTVPQVETPQLAEAAR